MKGGKERARELYVGTGLGSIGDTVKEDTEDTGLLSNFILTNF